MMEALQTLLRQTQEEAERRQKEEPIQEREEAEKRQDDKRRQEAEEAEERQTALILETEERQKEERKQEAEAVSYTHLDVYKRQVYACGVRACILHLRVKLWQVAPCPYRK